jgi:hypothetical protein
LGFLLWYDGSLWPVCGQRSVGGGRRQGSTTFAAEFERKAILLTALETAQRKSGAALAAKFSV